MKAQSTLTAKHQPLWRDYFLLTKPTVTMLVVVTVVPSLLFASQSLPHPIVIICAIVGTMLASASAAVFNQLVEFKLDHHMRRTRGRSVPSGRVSKLSASLYGILLGLISFLLLYYGTTPLATWIALAGHLFYVFVYTLYLKPRTAQNIVIGGAAGAVGPLIGWAAVSGELSISAWILFLIITLWTPPHFWALALKYKDDYAKAGIPMYPVIYGDQRTRKIILIYTVLLLPAVLSLYFSGTGSWLFLAVSIVTTLKFIWDATKIYLDNNNRYVMAFFHFSCLYTFIIFAALTLDWIIFYT